MSQPTPVPSTQTVGRLAIYVIVLLAIVAVVYFGAAALGIPIPPVVWTLAGIILVCVLLVLTIKFLMSLG